MPSRERQPLLPSLVAYLIYNDAAQVVGPARAGQAITLLPLFGVLVAVLLQPLEGAAHLLGVEPDRFDHEVEFVGAIDLACYRVGHSGPE
mgnify:CR=1 FL=1